MKQKIVVLLILILVSVSVIAAGEEIGSGEDFLILVNRDHPVAEGYVPADLVLLEDVIPEGLCTYEHEGIMGNREAALAWVSLLTAAHADGLDEWRFSEGYRTIADQQDLFDRTVQDYMDRVGMPEDFAIEVTMDTVAPAGTSEHHTGLAFDITVPGEYFGDTGQYLWMKEHCWEYGFILRYTEEWEDETGYMEEEWHYRYVGVENAMKIKELDTCLEQYLFWWIEE
ncbi:MAG: hypothetical protein CW338_03250 [Clostridiales bacterium]|nr:hypothetical protein [Clostridiales bacterium]